MSRRRFTPEERAALWHGWKSGLTLTEIGQGLDRRAVSVLNFLRRAGGFEPRTRSLLARGESTIRSLAQRCS